MSKRDHAAEQAERFRQNGPPQPIADGWPEDQRGDAWEGLAKRQQEFTATSLDERAPPPFVTFTLGKLLETFPTMREPVIHDLLRVGETMNVIAAPKVGKSWLVAGLAFAVATGRPWLDFETSAGDVLIIDNELHPETIAHRLRRVADANGYSIPEVGEHVTVLPLRGACAICTISVTFFASNLPDVSSWPSWMRSIEASPLGRTKTTMRKSPPSTTSSTATRITLAVPLC